MKTQKAISYWMIILFGVLTIKVFRDSIKQEVVEFCDNNKV